MAPEQTLIDRRFCLPIAALGWLTQHNTTQRVSALPRKHPNFRILRRSPGFPPVNLHGQNTATRTGRTVRV